MLPLLVTLAVPPWPPEVAEMPAPPKYDTAEMSPLLLTPTAAPSPLLVALIPFASALPYR